MTRATVTVTTYRAAVTCDGCGLRLYTWQRAGLDRWLEGKGWVVVDGRDYCPGCAGDKKAAKVRIDYSDEM